MLSKEGATLNRQRASFFVNYLRDPGQANREDFERFRRMMDLDSGHPSRPRLPDSQYSVSFAFITTISNHNTTIETPWFIVKGDRAFHDTKYSLVVQGASLAVAVWRMLLYSDVGRTISQLVLYLAATGCKFMTLYKVNKADVPSRPKWNIEFRTLLPCGLGIRKAGYKPDFTDLDMQMGFWTTFFRKRRARRLVCVGGIIWRLSIQEIGAEAAVDGPSFMNTPKENWNWDKIAVYKFNDGTIWGDDLVRQEEMDAVCGVYYVNNGTFV